MKILITGANGYLGQGIVKAIFNKGYEVIAADFKTNYVDNRVDRVDCNLFEIEKPYEYFGKPDVLLHLAWRDGFAHYADSHIADLPKHYDFIKSMGESGVKKIAALGSMHEIGFFEGSINEDTPCHPVTPYGIGKNALRDLVGNSKFGCSIFSKITAAEEKGEEEFPFTLGQNQYDFIDYDEFSEQVAATVIQDEVDGIINICSGRPEKLADRVERFIKENNYKIKLRYGAFPDRAYDSKAIWGDSRKIEMIMNK